MSAGDDVQHVAFIPDGNRRFARARGWDVERGYRAGAERMLDVVGWCLGRGIRRLSGFALSRENVRTRPTREISAVLDAVAYFAEELTHRYGAPPHVVGDLTTLAAHPASARLAALATPPPSDAPVKFHVVLNARPDAPGCDAIPRIDLVIRPGGHRRLSGFLPLQCGFAELWFDDVPWPAFTEDDLDAALAWYRSQDRTAGE